MCAFRAKKERIGFFMDRENMNNFYGMPPYNYDNNFDGGLGDNPMFNPIMQYEQAYMYYKYLTQQIEYKIKCKEYDKMYGNSGRSESSRGARE